MSSQWVDYGGISSNGNGPKEDTTNISAVARRNVLNESNSKKQHPLCYLQICKPTKSVPVKVVWNSEASVRQSKGVGPGRRKTQSYILISTYRHLKLSNSQIYLHNKLNCVKKSCVKCLTANFEKLHSENFPGKMSRVSLN